MLAETICEKIKGILTDVCAFSLLSDGSQARKTGSEKELVLVRVVKDGVARYFCVGLADIDAYGNANAENLKRALDDVFLQKIKISEDLY